MANPEKKETHELRKTIHCIKVGIAMTLVSLYYYTNPWSNINSQGAAMWAVMTVVVVFEFTVGGCLYKGLNRAVATLIAGCLALGIHWIASLSGDRFEPVILGLSVFVLASIATFYRFVTFIKVWFDYGVTIFILTFSLIAVSGYKQDTLFTLAQQRLYNIGIGIFICLLVCVLICPVWAGEDLHLLIIWNMEKLANSLEGCIAEYFKEGGVLLAVDEDQEAIIQRSEGYKHILSSKPSEDSLAILARWEPGHGCYGFRHPWNQYLKIGAAMRLCAYCLESLAGCIDSQTQVPESMKRHLSEACIKLSTNSSRILKELAKCIKFMKKSKYIDLLIRDQNNAVKELDRALRSLPPMEAMENFGCVSLLEGRVLITAASLLIEISARIIGVVEAVNLLAEQACFKPAKDQVEDEGMISSKTSFVVTLGPQAIRTIEEA
ncbi:hypothetical protein J5N97_019060 [Dioscorea zingiberensis]|uniref:Aluminum-activated malate transporter n=1 Tax=Dioscorea zingiberensis TaxID=325984 RepID=A0A9D5HC03_9LILI|nr:hypothetical protein J5N97_019060 [Dioscorea zingiberensis]